MTMLDLGQVQGSMLFFGGPYGNLQAVQSLHAQASKLGIAPANIICTGDVTAYCAQPNETCALLRQWGVHVVMGNCEESLAENRKDCGCGFGPDSACATLSESWYPYVHAELESTHRQWMQQLPRRIVFRFQQRKFTVIHGGVNIINRFIFASSPEQDKLDELNAAASDGIIAGHCGLPFSQIVDGRLWHNPGVLGMPANDGSARVWYSLWEAQGTGISIRHLSLEYDVSTAHRVMVERGLDNAYAQSLLTGLWPSQDILPAPERKQQGREIKECRWSYSG